MCASSFWPACPRPEQPPGVHRQTPAVPSARGRGSSGPFAADGNQPPQRRQNGASPPGSARQRCRDAQPAHTAVPARDWPPRAPSPGATGQPLQRDRPPRPNTSPGRRLTAPAKEVLADGPGQVDPLPRDLELSHLSGRRRSARTPELPACAPGSPAAQCPPRTRRAAHDPPPRPTGLRCPSAPTTAHCFTLPDGIAARDLPEGLRPRAGPGPDGSTVLHSESPLARLQMLGNRATGRGFDLPGLEVRRPSLEEVYLSLTSSASTKD